MSDAHLKTGAKGEEIAATYLKGQGYTIVARNVRNIGGELDLIAKQGETVVFIEVKTRTRNDGFAPSLRIDRAKVMRLRRAVGYWIEEQCARGASEFPARIDVIGVCGGSVVEHFEDVDG